MRVKLLAEENSGSLLIVFELTPNRHPSITCMYQMH